MRLTYDPKSDALSIRLRSARIHRSEDIGEGVSVMLDNDGAIIGFEGLAVQPLDDLVVLSRREC